MSSDLGLQKLSTQKKQTKQIEAMPNSLGSQQSSISNIPVTMMVPTVSNPGPQNLLTPNKRPTQVISMENSVGLQPSKRNSPMEPSPKGQSESSELVRSKLRESLATSLAMVHKHSSKAIENNSQSEAAGTLRPDDEDPHSAKSLSTAVDVGSCHPTLKPLENMLSGGKDCASYVNNFQASAPEVSVNVSTLGATQTIKSDEQDLQSKNVLLDEDISFNDNFLVKDELLQGNGLCWASDLQIDVPLEKENPAKRPRVLHEEIGGVGDGQSLQSPHALAIRIEDELFKLFGGVNKKYKEKGRSLLFNLKDRNNPELRERVMSGEIPPHRLCSMTAEDLASKELSRWRIAKAEELAQMVVLPDSEVDVRRFVKKTHKGEFEVEFEQDDGVSEEVALGSSLLPQFRPRPNEKDVEGPSKPNDPVTSEATSNEDNLQDQHPQSNIITLATDGNDLMEGLVVDELKDEEFLPPIVSLDEFMESLDSEPPFQNLPIDDGKPMLKSDEKPSSEDDTKLGASDHRSTNLVDTAPDKSDTADVRNTRADSNLKSNRIEKELETFSPGNAPKQDYVWEGLVQLNVSAMVTVTGYFKSGDKTSVKEWPNFLDVKGRVRLDAFEKFIQELPMSKTRAIMIVHFCWKEGSSESGRMNLCEVVESYIVDERVGFSEPVQGVELYLCPPHGKTLEILGKNLPKDQIETLNAVNDGLIGIVVWRKPHLTKTTSPNSSHKHSSKKQHSFSRRQQEKNATISGTRIPPFPIDPSTNPQLPLDNEPIDDVPPGFGPAASLDEDDLPEFEFAGGSNSALHSSHSIPGLAPPHSHVQPPPRPVEQMRELIHKYGQSEATSNRGNWTSHPWNDDDDIPEWQPQPQTPAPSLLPQQHMPTPTPTPAPAPPLPPSHNPMGPQLIHNLQQLNMPPHMVNQQHFVSMQVPPQQLQLQYPSQPFGQLMPLHSMAIQPVQAPTSMMMMQQGQQNMASPWQQGVCWTLQPGQPLQGNGLQSCNSGGQPVQVQFHPTPTGFGAVQNGMEWRPDLSRSRQF